MSKRFGRNQRRRARERIAELERFRAMNQELALRMSAQNAELRQAITEARFILGQHCIALPPEYAGDHPHPLGNSFNAYAPERLELAVFERDSACMTHAQQLQRMHTLLVDDGRYDVVRSMLHFNVTLDSGVVTYCISDSALRNMDRSMLQRRLAHEIGRQMAKLLVTKLREEKGRL